MKHVEDKSFYILKFSPNEDLLIYTTLTPVMIPDHLSAIWAFDICIQVLWPIR
jgi:hypothetical protein